MIHNKNETIKAHYTFKYRKSISVFETANFYCKFLKIYSKNNSTIAIKSNQKQNQVCHFLLTSPCITKFDVLILYDLQNIY